MKKQSKRMICLALVVCCMGAISCQLAPDAPQESSSSLKTVAGSSQRVGQAPHERPACQLAPLASSRRHFPLQTAQLAAEPTSEPAISNASGSRAESQQVGIVSPSVVSLQAANASSRMAQTKPLRLDSSERLRQLRQLLASNNYDAYLVTPNDEHGSEYVTDFDRRLRFISGFAGSNGYALILLERAVLFTDGRYALQAEKELDCNWWLVVSDEPLADIALWLRANAPKGLKIATDARLMSLQSFDYLDERVRELDSEFALISQDLVDVVWSNAEEAANRKRAQAPLQVHPLEFAGNVSWQEKLIRVAEAMARLRARHYIVSQLDDVAWLLNLRGADVPMAPLFKSYLLISRSSGAQPGEQSGAGTSRAAGLQAPPVLHLQASQTIRLTLYVDLKKVEPQVRDHLHLDNGSLVAHRPDAGEEPQTSRIQVELKDYELFIMDIRERLAPSAGARQLHGRLLLDASANVAVHVLAKAYDDRLVLLESLIGRLKSVKSEREVEGMRLAHYRDSLAISMLLAQLELDIGHRKLTSKWTEVGAANELELYRSLMDLNRGQSFETISAYGANAAVVHYRPSALEPRLISNLSTYLLDSGGQYLDGTTDITRTTHYGRPSEFQRETYTRVLMGAIDTMALVLDQSARTPYRINDLIARRYLLELGLDYKHGTGHGIGLYSLVHEAPALIEHYAAGGAKLQASAARQVQVQAQTQAKQAQVSSEPVFLQANMFTSVEPGYYKANDFGIRLENIVVSQRLHLGPQEAARPTGSERLLLRFEPISLVPFEPKLMKLELLSNRQKAWLNSYNLMVRLKMTQQINYYLSKVRNSQTSAGQVSGAGSGSRLRLFSEPPTNSSTDLGYYNFLRLDGAKFQEKLEQTHRWIMAKTELIPLDVPQSLISGAAQHSAPIRSSEGAQLDSLDGQRLMLAYMSSLPFKDADAAEASASLQLTARGQLSANSSQLAAGNRCAGLECDLWLLSALNSQTNSNQQTGFDPANDFNSDPAPKSSSSLMDLFQLSGSSGQLVSINMWSLVALLALAALQISIMTYMWRTNLCSSSRNQHQVS